MSLRDLMINYRAKERITQEELAQRCGLSRKWVNQIENGKLLPSPVTEAKIRIAIGADKEV